MKYPNWMRGVSLLGLILYTMGGYASPNNESFHYQLKMLALPSFLEDGQLFLDPELASGNWFGGGITVGDWNQDGNQDLLISSFLADPDGVSNAGAVYAFLGPDFEISERITALPEPESGDDFGMQVAFQDMNQDQVDDLIVTCLRSNYLAEDGTILYNQAGSFRVIWGPSYEEGIRYFDEIPQEKGTLGRALAVGDFNEDGHRDIALGSIGAYNGVGKVIFRFGPDYLQQTELFTPYVYDGMRFGASLGSGDWNRDGHLDLFIGADYAYSQSDLSGAGHVQIWYGPDFQEEDVMVLDEPQPAIDNHFGTSIDFGDVTGDGIPDLVVGLSGKTWEGKGWVGQVQIFPGPDYESVIELDSPQQAENSIFGSELAIADVNADGVNDLVVGEYYATVDGLSMAGRAWLFLGIKTAVPDWALF